ncbi:Hpt domain-containing protein [Aliiruegeria lutimaris]|uniref:HPt (Histidine-containing phosphotransfer) domain-containing protein n=1 Tax=Aliiruegeria lutimaris TaxID=571298 RepID=A0A1G9KW59_9RHOB|nr:Hpt domain-containing protein [Aliiruegeria lutimaris]SDL53942.1 HPt (histidine-containing phosphotransfer) domain-containing protein [Aliiruegeria lutimaris]
MEDDQIDRGALRKLLALLGNDPAELEDLLSDYYQDAPDLAQRIVDSAARGDVEALRIASHSLKSNARDFGALRLSDLCADLEKECRAGSPRDPQQAAQAIRLAEETARQALSEIEISGLSAESGD